MSNNGTEPQTGIVYPSITIGGRAYTLKFSLGALFRLEEQGIDLGTLGAELRSWAAKKDAEGNVIEQGRVKITMLCKLVAAAIGDQVTLTPTQIADMLEFSDLFEVVEKVSIALGKMRPPTKVVKLQEPEAPQVPLN